MFKNSKEKNKNETIKINKLNNICQKLTQSANQVVSFFESNLKEDGSYGDKVKDIACYFKSPMMFITANKPEMATRSLSYIKKNFMELNGDFKSDNNCKSINPAYIEYWSYSNGWIVRAANHLKMSDISDQGNEYLKQYFISNDHGFLTNKIENNTGIVDVLTVAHHGLINLEMDNLDVAVSAGKYLCRAIDIQPKLEKGFYLRLDKEGKLLTDFSKEQAAFYFVSASEPDQLHFMIGYPAAFLALLYQKTEMDIFLESAKVYLNFSLSNPNVYCCNFSHKIAWAASIMYSCTGDSNYLKAINNIADHFISQQKNGMWYTEDVNSSYDQSAEIACWFLDIVKNINDFKKKFILDNGQLQQNNSVQKWPLWRNHNNNENKQIKSTEIHLDKKNNLNNIR